MEDRGLIARAQVGDPDALAELLASVRPLVNHYARKKLSSTWAGNEAAEDVTQEALLGLYLALPDWQDDGWPFMAFVYRIARNKVSDVMRRIYRRPEVFVEEDRDQEADPAPTPEDQVILTESVNEVYTLLDRLSGTQGESLRLKGQELDASEVGQRMGKTANAVRVEQHRGLKELKRMIGEQ